MATSRTGLPVPDLGAAPNVPADMLTLANKLDSVTVPAFASASARDAALSAMSAAGAAPFVVCSVAGVFQSKVGSSWIRIPVDYGSLTRRWVGSRSVQGGPTAGGVETTNLSVSIPAAEFLAGVYIVKAVGLYQQATGASTSSAHWLTVPISGKGVQFTTGSAAVNDYLSVCLSENLVVTQAQSGVQSAFTLSARAAVTGLNFLVGSNITVVRAMDFV